MMLRRGTINRQKDLPAEQPTKRLSFLLHSPTRNFDILNFFPNLVGRTAKYLFVRVYTKQPFFFARVLRLTLHGKKQTDDQNQSIL